MILIIITVKAGPLIIAVILKSNSSCFGGKSHQNFQN